MNLKELLHKVLSGGEISREEALFLYQAPLEELCQGADQIRRHFCGSQFDLCAIINGKSGHCSENCKFCAQSAHNSCGTPCYPLMDTEQILQQAKNAQAQGALRYAIVTSGKALSDAEVDKMCETIQAVRRETDISVCISFGLLTQEQYEKLKQAGVSRVHNNLETSERHFPDICTTHTFADKVTAIRNAQAAGLSVCSGGIMGIGETPEDRIDMALALRSLGIGSIPVNMLNPIPGTPMAQQEKLREEDLRRIVAVYRFLLPKAAIRLAGGRSLLPDQGRSCFQSGANAAISGDMLTTAGIGLQTDLEILKELGYEAGRQDG